MALITGYQAGEFKANEWVILSHLLNVIYYFVRWFNKCIFAPIFFFTVVESLENHYYY